MADDWSIEEVEATVSDYFEMLAMELRGESYNKAEHNRNLQNLLNGRTKGAIEKKHQNISAVLIDLGYPYIDGYKPLENYQGLLYDVVEDRLVKRPDLNQAAANIVQQPIEQIPAVDKLILVSPPHKEEDKTKLYDRPAQPRKPVRRNYLEIESRNQTLGLAGERLILEFEHKRLWQAGKKVLAERIQHVAETEGDGLGFDILSFETDGRERLIEVKTTRFGELTPFFASKNEVEISHTRQNEYQLYRLFKFTQEPKLYILPGALRDSCLLDPIQYSALPR
jgi:Domain of unknown function (DUF3883)